MHRLHAYQLAEKFRSGELSAREIAEHFLSRIEKHDREIGAFLHVMKGRVLAEADSLDAKRAEGKPLGKLAGVPIAIKDNIHIRGEKTTCASKMLENYVAPFDATVVELLRREDALLIGKTNLDEFAMGSSNENSAFYPVKNPWDLSCVPGGSSGGSAAAVAARLCPIALGTDTGGSIRQPAALCGVVGLKPTYARVSRYGLVAFGSSLDQIGPITTCARDAALAMEAIAHHDDRDATSLPEPSTSYTEVLDESIAGKVIGVPWKFLQELDSEILENFRASMAVMEKLGCKIVEIDLEVLKWSLSVYYVLACAEVSTNLAKFDGVRFGYRSKEAKTLEEIYRLSRTEGFGEEVKRRILLGTYLLSSGHQDAFYKKAQRVRTLIVRQFSAAFESCDVIALPTSPIPAFEIGQIADPLKMYLQDIYTIGMSLAGVPTISTPCGFTSDKKPLGLQFVSPQRNDSVALRFAHHFESNTPWASELPEMAKEGA